MMEIDSSRESGEFRAGLRRHPDQRSGSNEFDAEAMLNCGLAGPRRFTLLLLERSCLSIRTKAGHSNAHHSRPYDWCGVEISEMPALLRQKRRRRTESYRAKSHGR